MRCPAGPFTVIARDDSAVSWFAFKPPSEIAWGSAMVNQMIQYTATLGFAAVALAALAIALEIQDRLNARRAGQAATR